MQESEYQRIPMTSMISIIVEELAALLNSGS
jgi:hypothetical protein